MAHNAKVYLISDNHIGHADIHEKWRTEFCSQSDHDETMIQAWNTVVRRNDIVKVLGDFVIGTKNLHYINELNGQIHWTMGNHDPKITRDILNSYPRISYVDGVRPYKNAVLSHVPIHPDELNYRGWKVNIHGHIHVVGNAPNVRQDHRYYNVNADVMGYFPKEFHSIMREAGYEL